MSEWMPIESAPRDGSEVDLWVVFPSRGMRWPNARWLNAGEHACS